MEAFTEFLSKAEVDIGMQAKHASTREAAQEELLICLGVTLKDKLQTLWRYKKSEEMIKLLFLKVVSLYLLISLYYRLFQSYSLKIVLQILLEIGLISFLN